MAARLPPVGTYVALAFAISWILWLPVAVAFPDASDPPWWALVLVFVGVYGPSAAAVATAAIRGGRAELRELTGRLTRWQVGWWWYLLVVFAPPALVWIGAGIHTALGGRIDAAGLAGLGSAAVILATYLPFGPLGEELGWRGYALPSLDARLPPLVSGVALGLIWAAWHTPVFWIPTVGLPGRNAAAVGLWTANVVGFSILLSFVARRTAYSVPIAILLHAALNAGPAMGSAVFTAVGSELEEIRSWAQVIRWLLVLAAAVWLTRERHGIASPDCLVPPGRRPQ